MDLEKLSPAPWQVEKRGGQFAIFRDDKECREWIAGLSVIVGKDTAEFIALARNAFEVMMRRGWACFRWRDGKWRPHMAGMQSLCTVYDSLMPAQETQPSFDDPFTALVEADRWYRDNVEKKP